MFKITPRKKRKLYWVARRKVWPNPQKIDNKPIFLNYLNLKKTTSELSDKNVFESDGTNVASTKDSIEEFQPSTKDSIEEFPSLVFGGKKRRKSRNKSRNKSRKKRKSLKRSHRKRR